MIVKVFYERIKEETMKLSLILKIALLMGISIFVLTGSTGQNCGGEAPQGPQGICYIHLVDDTVTIENTSEEACFNMRWDTGTYPGAIGYTFEPY
jgi:hypothetical protein